MKAPGVRFLGVLALLGATLFWAGNYVVGGAVVAAVPPADLTAMRWAIAVPPLFVLAQVIERPDWRAVLRVWPRLLLPALFGMLAYNLLLYSALQHTTAITASLINAFNPALISIAAAVFLRQRLTPAATGGILLALAGVLWILSGGRLDTLLATGFGLGELLMLGTIAAWTVYTLIGRRGFGIPVLTATAVQALLAVVILAPFVLLTGGPHLPTTGPGIWALLYLGLFPSVASYALWNTALTTIPAARAGVFLNLITVFTVLISVTLGRPLTLAQVAGGLAVLAGVALTALTNQRAPRRDQAPRATASSSEALNLLPAANPPTDQPAGP